MRRRLFREGVGRGEYSVPGSSRQEASAFTSSTGKVQMGWIRKGSDLSVKAIQSELRLVSGRGWCDASVVDDPHFRGYIGEYGSSALAMCTKRVLHRAGWCKFSFRADVHEDCSNASAQSTNSPKCCATPTVFQQISRFTEAFVARKSEI